MDIDKDLIGKPPNQAIVINEQLIKREETYGKVSDQGKCDNFGTVENKTSQVPELDSREELFNCIWHEIITMLRNKKRRHDPDFWYANIVSWLDRQAEITGRETVKQWEEQASELVCKVNELTAERDSLRSRLKTQANNFQKLERDNAKLRDTLARVRELVGDAE